MVWYNFIIQPKQDKTTQEKTKQNKTKTKTKLKTSASELHPLAHSLALQHLLGAEHVGFVLASDGVCDIATGDDIAAVVGEVSHKS